ncbi:collagen-binding domain-containing protein [Gayadomonas joobiniege]|uniref:collagen-binding domain-containing protein n=1 Tax=Gayadomonas joobiniege TaxID=1234606 RepID=UPI00037C5E05|nr:collagen-binding domain-containing protein [Gayadomonas joobiniege]
MKYLSGFLLACCFSFSAQAALVLSPENFSLVVNNNASLKNGVHVHGGAYVGGDLISGDNASYGQDRASTGPVLYVDGSFTLGRNSKNNGAELFNQDYYIGDATGFKAKGSSQAVAAAQNHTNFYDLFVSQSQQWANLTDYGVTIDTTTKNNEPTFKLTSGALNVINLNDINGSFLQNNNANLLFQGMTDDTYVVINYNLNSDLTINAKNNSFQSSQFENVIWNFVGGYDLTFNPNVSTWEGSIYATDAKVNWLANDIDGQLVADSLSWNKTSQSHFYVPDWENFTATVAGPSTSTHPVPVPEPSMFVLLSLALIGMYFIQSKKQLNRSKFK